uniref:Metallophos domain-containing protein n=1 Tax=Caenorhabditis tropicalis TaxID=1561998 RepID=A0A1I7UAB0_9PELO
MHGFRERDDGEKACLFDDLSSMESGCQHLIGDVLIDSKNEKYTWKLENVTNIYGELAVLGTVELTNEECIRTYGNELGQDYYCRVNDMFRAMPICGIFNGKIFCCHGGPTPDMIAPLQFFERIKKVPTNDIEARANLCVRWADYKETHPLTREKLKLHEMFTTKEIRCAGIQNFTQHGAIYGLRMIGCIFVFEDIRSCNTEYSSLLVSVDAQTTHLRTTLDGIRQLKSYLIKT